MEKELESGERRPKHRSIVEKCFSGSGGIEEAAQSGTQIHPGEPKNL
jgi:hypothetical protein